MSQLLQRIVDAIDVGITGTVSIDENGDRNADYSLLDLNVETQVFEASIPFEEVTHYL